MAKKQNPLLASYEALWEARYTARLREALRICEDANLISTDDVVGLTEEQANELKRVFRETVREITKLIAEDSLDDPDVEWSRAKVDRRICGIVGEKNFQEWDVRHS